MNVEIEAEAALFPEKEYINGIFIAVQLRNMVQWRPWFSSKHIIPFLFF
jgi:hypothetical protein